MTISIHDNQITTLKSLGVNETWLRDWIQEKPSRLGLGNITIKAVEVQHSMKAGGRLDILAYQADVDTFYEIELMLGEVNSDHGFRCLDYWARERLKRPNAKHIAVLVAEDLSGRYQTVIDTLPDFLPFIAIELRVLTLNDDNKSATIVPLIIAQPDELVLGSSDAPSDEQYTDNKKAPRDRAWWEENSSAGYMATVDALIDICSKNCGPSSVDTTASSYISLKKGKRCWLPMWKRQNGVYVYLPGGPGGTEDAPSDFYHEVATVLSEIGLDQPSWSYKYNAGANPIGFSIPAEKVQHSLILEILRKAYQLV